jgi:ubiquinone/menaquinone biosynthesis C-methylase UbiE
MPCTTPRGPAPRWSSPARGNEVLADHHPLAADPEAFKIRDASSYDAVAAEFDRLAERCSRPLAARMVALATLAPAERVLDIGTGTGIVALQAAGGVGPLGRVLGIDLSDGMLSVARAKAAQVNLTDRVLFRKMDAEALPLDPGSFDAVLSLFALLHFPSPLTALREMFRVLRPGGRLIIAVGSRPPWASSGALLHCIGRLPEFLFQLQGKRLSAPGFLNALVREHLPEGEAVEESPLARRGRNRTRSVPFLVGRAGFTGVRSYWEGHRMFIDTPEEFWTLQATVSSVARKRLSVAPPEKVAGLREEFFRVCRQVQSRGGRFVYPYAALFVIARRPASCAS